MGKNGVNLFYSYKVVKIDRWRDEQATADSRSYITILPRQCDFFPLPLCCTYNIQKTSQHDEFWQNPPEFAGKSHDRNGFNVLINHPSIHLSGQLSSLRVESTTWNQFLVDFYLFTLILSILILFSLHKTTYTSCVIIVLLLISFYTHCYIVKCCTGHFSVLFFFASQVLCPQAS